MAVQEIVDPSDLAELLGGDVRVDDEGLHHHAGADAALGALLGLKKSGRKRGNLEAQRQGLQIRIRALDLLEVGGVFCVYDRRKVPLKRFAFPSGR